MGGEVSVGGLTVEIVGVRLTLWLGGLIILVAGVLALRALRPGAAEAPKAAPAAEP